MSTHPLPLTHRDFQSDQEVRWCPGCGDYSILRQLQKVLPECGVVREKIVFVSGIGCSSRFPYYMKTYGIHGIHGRAPAIASGVKLANPELKVWVITGDGDALSIGGNHFMHTIRRNIGMKIILFNNRIYGLTKGQYSPTSEFGKRSRSSPFGAIDYPVRPISVAIGAEVTFVARCVDMDVPNMVKVLTRAAQHKGTAFVEIYQDCNVYNHGAFQYATDRKTKADHVVYLEHGQPMIFGKDKDKGIRFNGHELEVVELGQGVTVDDLVIHDERTSEPGLAYLLSRMRYPELPEPIGVFRAIETPTYEDLMMDQINAATEKAGPGDLDELFNSGDTWTVD
ncbi:MAG: 2-oxoacid:ferredoxin oxidoreductase subunit beta [Planctomycetes bacterium]|nr:2-oxoacid:ferredoxin oxidoreductase subunit beta [Planctomycetota bacterium]